MIARLDDLTAVSVHLGLGGAERGRHVEQLLEILGSIDEPVVVGGDLNAYPEDTVPAAIARRYPDVWERTRDSRYQGQSQGSTFPSDEPIARIDYLFASPAVRPLRAWVAGTTVSDHLMVIADIQVGG